jgi:multidrug efflux system outer membrane protein
VDHAPSINPKDRNSANIPISKTDRRRAALALLAGCAHVPADTSKAAAPISPSAQHAPAIEPAGRRLARDQWWLAYNDPQLNALVARALKDNPTLAVAGRACASARAVSGAAERADAGAQVGLATA